MKITQKQFYRVVHFLLLLTSVISANAYAIDNSRAEKWEFFLAPMFTNSKSLDFDGGARADINERSSLGLGFAYNLNSHIELSLLFTASSSNYTGTRIVDSEPENPANLNETQQFTSNLYSSSIIFGFTYNFLRGPFTPYITGNIGSTYIDSGIPTGNIVTGCWWDPWYGYICTPTAQTYTSTEFTYGATAGLRYDFNQKVYIKGGVGKNYIDINSSNTPDFTTYELIVGFMF